jgi:predicted nucleotidyltransferase
VVGSVAEAQRLAGTAVAEARRHIPVTDAVLFGSHVEGTPHEHSDVDLAIFSPAVDAMTTRQYLDTCRAISKATGYVVEVHLFSETARREARPSNFVGYILAHGRRIA